MKTLSTLAIIASLALPVTAFADAPKTADKAPAANAYSPKTEAKADAPKADMKSDAKADAKTDAK